MSINVVLEHLTRIASVHLSEVPFNYGLQAYEPIGNVNTYILYSPETKVYMIGSLNRVYPYFCTKKFSEAASRISNEMLKAMNFQDGYKFMEQFQDDITATLEFAEKNKIRIAFPTVVNIVEA